MPNFQGSVLGALLTLLGWDGTDFQNVKVDSDGHLQIDALTVADLSGALESVDTDGLVAYIAKFSGSWAPLSLDAGNRLMVVVDLAALPADAATETSLQGVEDRIGALAAPASGSVNWRLDKILTEVTTPSLSPDAATETSLQGIEDQVKDTLWNIKDYLFDYVSTTASGANFTGYSTSVPAGELWHITMIAAFNVTRVATQIRIGTRIGASTLWFFDDSSPTVNIQSTWSGHVWLGVNDEVAIYMTGCQADDVIRYMLWGHKMTV